MTAVSTESLAVLGARIADATREPWLWDAALAPFALGLGFYIFVIARFDRRQLTSGLGDHWVAGGAVAISTLAAGRIALAADALRALGAIHTALTIVAIIAWIITLAWLPILLGAEVLRPRLRYDVRRWSTVFPVGMYAACSYVIADVTPARGITEFARVSTVAAFALWLVVTAAAVRGGLRRVLDTGRAL